MFFIQIQILIALIRTSTVINLCEPLLSPESLRQSRDLLVCSA